MDRQNIVTVKLAICQVNDVELTFYINLSLQGKKKKKKKNENENATKKIKRKEAEKSMV